MATNSNKTVLELQSDKLKKNISSCKKYIDKARTKVTQEPKSAQAKAHLALAITHYITAQEELHWFEYDISEDCVKCAALERAHKLISIRTLICDENDALVEEALTACEQAAKLDNKCVVVWYTKSKLLWVIGKYAESVECIHEALRLNPQDDNAKRLFSHIDSEETWFNGDGILKPREKSIWIGAVENESNSLRTKKGIIVENEGDKEIAEYLDEKDIGYDYDNQIALKSIENNNSGNTTQFIRPDFYLTEFNIIIEYWHLKGSREYDEQAEWKRRIYKECNQRFISIEPDDLKNIDRILNEKLKRMGVNV